jgi:hypothetical protein
MRPDTRWRVAGAELAGLLSGLSAFFGKMNAKCRGDDAPAEMQRGFCGFVRHCLLLLIARQALQNRRSRRMGMSSEFAVEILFHFFVHDKPFRSRIGNF